jgi:hypothetical protein
VHYDVTSNFCGGKIQTIVLNGNAATYYTISQFYHPSMYRVNYGLKFNVYKIFICSPSFRIPHQVITNIKITIPKINIFSLSSTRFFCYPFPPLPYLFHLSYFISLPSSFSVSLRSFLSLSFVSLHP